ncbi:MAG: glycosyltransferase [Arenicella sp.]|nr:glycosyltransferase [Arenicella sp.]
MAKVDLHVHSKYSDYPSTWAHKFYKSPDSFTEPETVYRQAKTRGMTLVTITDHDDIRGALELVARHPMDSFVSCEVTTYFPEDDCKIYILVYGINERQYEEIMIVRSSIYDFRNYIVENNIAYSVAHATYDQDGKFTFSHIEKLVLLFDVFEVINGGGDAQNNLMLHRYLDALDDETLDELQAKHKIQPISVDPWIKSYTGGADDHCGILIGTAYTQSDATTVAEFLNSLRRKHTTANGLHGTFETYATGVIKHIHDYRLDRDSSYSSSKMNEFLELFFSGTEGNLFSRFKKSRSLKYLKRKNSKTHNALHRLLSHIEKLKTEDLATKVPVIYEDIKYLHDEMFVTVINAIVKSFPQGDIFTAFQKFATVFPMTLLAMPFLGSMRHQVLKKDLKQGLIGATSQPYTQKALWFTDTIDDLNGVSVTLRQIAAHSMSEGYQLKLVTCVDEANLKQPLPSNTLNFHPIKSIEIPGYEQQLVGFPSLLAMMKAIVAEQADQVIISTPGPLGLGALLCAKLMDLPVKCIYHTDFAEQLYRMTGEETLAQLSNWVVNKFYAQADTVFVPSHAYIQKLDHAGLDRNRLRIFPRGLNLDLYKPAEPGMSSMLPPEITGDFTLLFAGRISEDKNLNTLLNIFRLAEQQSKRRYNLVIAGDGPDLPKIKQELMGYPNVVFTNRVAPEELVAWYQTADLLVFPSHTDTFGMVVLEGLACGLPALVTATGGPQEIIQPGITGQVIELDKPQLWLGAIEFYRSLKLQNPLAYQELRESCSYQVNQHNNWQPVFDEVLGNECRLPKLSLIKVSDSNVGTTNQQHAAA